MDKKSNPLYKTSKDSWIKKGLLYIKRHGISSISVQSVADKLQVTKGSFYHHFNSLNAYEIAIAKYWSDDLLSDLRNAHSNNLADSISNFYNTLNISEENNFRIWAEINKEISPYIQSVDSKRIEFLQNLYSIKYGKNESMAKAYLEYSSYIGLQQLFKNLEKESIKLITKEFVQTFRH